MINIYYRQTKESKLASLDSFQTGAWVDFVGDSSEEIKRVSELLGISEDFLNDAMDVYEVPRVEIEAGDIFVYLRIPDDSSGSQTTSTLLIAIGADYLLTAARLKHRLLENFRNGKKDFFTTEKARLFFEIVKEIDSAYSKKILELNKRIKSIKYNLQKINHSDIIQFVDIEQVFNEYISALIPINGALEKILKGNYLTLHEEDRDLIEDIYLSNGQLIGNAKSSLRNAENIRKAYSNIINYELNRSMKKLTALTIIMTIPTMIFSFYGMNTTLPGAGSASSFIYVLLLTVALSVFFFLILRKSRWL